MRAHESSMPNESESLNSHQLSSSFGPALKCHSDQNFRTLCFCIFLIYQWFLLTCPNHSAVRVREGRFFRLFLSRFFGRHYSNTFPRITSLGREFTGCDVKHVTREMLVALQNFASLIQPFEISNPVLQQQ